MSQADADVDAMIANAASANEVTQSGGHERRPDAREARAEAPSR